MNTLCEINTSRTSQRKPQALNLHIDMTRRGVEEAAATARDIISHKVVSKSFCRRELPKKTVDLSFSITNIKDKLMGQ